MSREWKPGTVAVATVRGIEGVRVFRVGLSAGPTWLSVSRVKDCLTHEDKHVTRVRPLVVLDPKAHRFYPELLVRALRTKTGYTTLADAIEAQTCPPKPPEPGLWAVVEATAEGIPRRRWVHHEEDRWICDSGEWRYWDDLADPQLIREGIQS